MKNKLLIVLKALLEGYQIKVKIGDEYETLALSEDNYLCLKMLSHNVDGSENEQWTKNIGSSLGDFINMGEKMSDIDILTIASNNALNEIKKEKYGKNNNR